MNYNVGDKYESDWKNTSKDKKGIMFYDNGEKFEGN